MEKLSNLELAISAYEPQNYVEITELEHQLYTTNNPLTLCIKKELYEKLSADAKIIIYLALDTTMNIFSILISPKGNKPYIPKKKTTPTTRLIENYLKWVYKWKGIRIRTALDEVTTFVAYIT